MAAVNPPGVPKRTRISSSSLPVSRVDVASGVCSLFFGDLCCVNVVLRLLCQFLQLHTPLSVDVPSMAGRTGGKEVSSWCLHRGGRKSCGYPWPAAAHPLLFAQIMSSWWRRCTPRVNCAYHSLLTISVERREKLRQWGQRQRGRVSSTTSASGCGERMHCIPKRRENDTWEAKVIRVHCP